MPRSPFLGLVPYTEDDAALFFGRERDRQIITANLLAARLTLLWGESGTGKTSVLRAGVLHALHRQAADDLARGDTPEFLAVECSAWKDDPIAAIAGAIGDAARELYGERAAAESPGSEMTLAELVTWWAARLDADILLVLDQFEELFLYHEGRDARFATQFAELVNRPDLPVNILVAIREDALAKLDRFKGLIPDLFANYLRIQHLDRAAARDAILKPVETYNRSLPAGAPRVSVEPVLVARVLDEIRTGRVQVGGAGDGMAAEGMAATPEGESGQRVEAPFLQLVMAALWKAEMDQGSSELRLATLETLGGSGQIVRSHLDSAMAALGDAHRRVAGRVLGRLVTRADTKIATSAAELASLADLPEDEVEATLEALAGGRARVLRAISPAPGSSDSRYEVFHDVMAPAIRAWVARFREEEELERAKGQAQQRVRAVRLRAVGAVAAVLLIAGVGFTFALLQQERAARSRATAAQAVDMIASDPQDGLRLALQAWETSETPEAEEAIRLALSESRLAALIDHDDDVVGVSFSPDGSQVLSASTDGTARISDAETGASVVVFDPDGDAALTGARFSPDGSLVVTTSTDGWAHVWDADGDLLHTLDHGDRQLAVRIATSDRINDAGDYVATGAFSADGELVVTSAGRNAWVWELEDGSEVNRLSHPLRSSGEVAHAAFAPDGDRIVTSANDPFTRVWTVDGSTWEIAYDNGTERVAMAVFDQSGRFVAAANSDGSACIHDTEAEEDGECITSAWEHDASGVTSVAFVGEELGSREERSVVGRQPALLRFVTGGDTTAWVWDLDDSGLDEEEAELVEAVPRTTIRPHSGQVTTVAFSPDGRYVVTGHADGSAQLADATIGNRLLVLRGHDGPVTALAVDPIGSTLVTGGTDGTARVWRLRASPDDRELAGHLKAVLDARYDAAETSIVTSSLDLSARVWESSGGSETAVLIGDADLAYEMWPFRSAQFIGSTADEVIVAQAAGIVSRWDVSSAEPVDDCCRRVDAVPMWLHLMTPEAEGLLVRYDDGLLQSWTATDGAWSADRSYGQEAVLAAAVDGSGDTVATFESDDRIRIWDLASAEMISEWPAARGVTAIAFSPNGSQLITGGLDPDHLVRVWDVDDKELARSLEGNPTAVSAVAFSPDGEWIVSGSIDGVTNVWRASDGGHLARFRRHTDTINHIVISEDGLILTASGDRTAKISRCPVCDPIDDIIEAAREQVAVDRATAENGTSPSGSP